MRIIDYHPDMIPRPGDIIAGMPNSVYHASDGISKSGLDLVARSPAHYRYGPPRAASRAMEIGSAMHSALLEPEMFARDYVNSGATDRRSTEYKQALKSLGDADRVLTQGEHDQIAGAVAALWAQDGPRLLLNSATFREMSVFATDPETGMMVRARPDIVCLFSAVMADLKSTQDARVPAFERAIMNYRYHVQAAYYMDVWEWATGERIEEFDILAVESAPPHAAKIYRMDDTAIAEGRRSYREALNIYARCFERDDWPGYENDAPELIGLPDWLVAQIENNMEVSIDE